jgi:hypothetical protein
LERAEGLAGTSMRQGFHLQNKEIDRTDELLKSSGYQKNQVLNSLSQLGTRQAFFVFLEGR